VSETLLEITDVGRQIEVDPNKNGPTIRNVKILGLVSKNGREYLPAALKKAVAMYEGRAVNVDHTNRTDHRSYRDRIGVLRRVRFVENRGLFGDLHYNPQHPLANQLVWDSVHSPENVGLSHSAHGRVVRRGDKLVVEEIESVNSVDLVADPATTSGLFETAARASTSIGEGEARQPLTKAELVVEVREIRAMAAARGSAIDPAAGEVYGGPRSWKDGLPTRRDSRPAMTPLGRAIGWRQ
jgi:hypothetical protein